MKPQERSSSPRSHKRHHRDQSSDSSGSPSPVHKHKKKGKREHSPTKHHKSKKHKERRRSASPSDNDSDSNRHRHRHDKHRRDRDRERDRDRDHDRHEPQRRVKQEPDDRRHPARSRWEDDDDRPIKREPADDMREQRRHRERNDDRRRDARRQRDRNPEENDFGRQPKEEPKEKDKPNFELSGKLTEDTNTFRGVVIKYNEPPEARKPRRRWRLYGFKGEESLPMLPIHRQSAYLLGRDRRVADIPVDHPSCSKQHAVLQFRLTDYIRPDGSDGRKVRPYIIDLGSANGTFVNNKQVDAQRYVELFERDVIKFGFSSREYVLLHENVDTAEIEENEEGVDSD